VVKTLRFLFDFYINASIHVALSVFSLFYFFVLSHELPYSEPLAYTIFFGTITGYNLVKYAPLAKLHHRSLTKNLRLIQLFSFICFIALVYYIVQLPMRTLLCFFVGIIVLLGYAFPLLKQKNLRSISALKIYLVAFCWSLAVVLAPAIHYKVVVNYKIILEAIQVFLLVIALIIPFDIRDLKYDSHLLATLPQRFGVQKSKRIAYFLLGFYFIVDFVFGAKTSYKISLVVIVVTSLLIYKMPNKPVKYYCSFGIESIPIVKLVIFLLFVI